MGKIKKRAQRRSAIRKIFNATNMKNLVNTKKRLFDDTESDFYVFSSILDTPDFGPVHFDNRQVQYLWELGERQADALVCLIPGARKHLDFPGDTPAYKQGNLALYVQRVTGRDANHSVFIVVAAGEAQPARFVIDLCGVFVDE